MKYIISSLLYLGILLSLSLFVFEPSHLYYEIPWLDIPMHLMGGFGVASLALSIARYKKYALSFRAMLFVFFIVAIGWELYELGHDIASNQEWGGWSDTLSDLFNGAMGAVSSYYLLKK